MMNAIIETAQEYIGLAEFPGAKHNEKIVKMFSDTGNSWVADDETPWCAAFVGSVLAQCGIKGTGRLNARSYLEWGQKIAIKDAQPGDVVILSRGSNPTQGHVAFFSSWKNNGYVNLLGGNQGDKVSIAAYSVSKVIGVRRAVAPAKPRTSPVQSSTVQASAVQMASGAGAGIAAVGALDGTAQIVALAFVGITILAAAWIMRERIKKWAEGDK